MVYIPSLNDLPATAVAERNYLQDHYIKSMVVVPLVYGKALTGFLGFSSVRSEKNWSEVDIALLRMVGEILASAIDHERVEQALRKSEERYTLAIRGANDGLWDWNLKTNSIYFSPRWKNMLGYSEQEISTSPDEWLGRVHPEDLDQVKVDLSTHLQGLTPHFESEHRMRHKDGSYRWMLCRGLAVRPVTVSANGPELGPPYRMAGSQTDITERKQAEEQIQHDAFHDALTGLPNRALFLDRLSRAIERSSRRPDHPFAVLFLDLDRFKVINDSLGHFIGDQLLVAISSRLNACLRSVDTAARLGGDEFVILLEDLLDTDAIQIAERIRQELNHPFILDGHETVTTASIGIVTGIGYERPADVLRDADIALYRAKALGKNRYVVFDTSLRTRAMARLELESELRSALERSEFELYYQPIQLLDSDRITGFEALLRWRSPRRGMILPVEFVPVAEETGLIVPIGEWVLGEACRQARKWQEQFPMDPPLAINVNISGIQFAHPLLVEQVAQTLKESGLPPNHLRLEITESVIMENAEQAQNVLLKLRDLGVQLQIDDFGTGYSSLAYLQRFPIHTIKIDRSFVSRIGAKNESGNASEIVKTIINLAHDLNMDSVAEGVETEEQLARLKDLNCQYGQGFFIARPLDASAAEALLARAVLREPSGFS
jgi:diguanylate cyclase (GGDEF)-like protein/PAS domain S-box-containing protein